MKSALRALARRMESAGPVRLGAALACYFAVVFVLRMSLFPGASDDDAEILYYTQSWALTYKAGQPPLYAWLSLLAQAVLGPTMGSVLVVKYGLLAAFYAFVYLAARRFYGDYLFAALAPLAVMACFFIGWDTVVNYSHTVLLLCMMAAVLWLLLRLARNHGPADYGWLTLGMAAGLLAKYNFVLFLAPLLLAAWRHPELRPRVYTGRFALCLGIAAVLAAVPWAAFLLGGGVDAATDAGRLFPPVDDRLAALRRGMGQFALSSLGLVSPFLPLALILFPRAWLPLKRPSDARVHAGRLLEAYLLALLVLAVLAIAVSGATDVRNNWLVVWFPLPLYLLLRIKVWCDGADARGRAAWLTGVLVAIALAVPVGLAARGVVGPETCRKCNFFIPYADLADALTAAGFRDGTIVAQDRPNQLAGNLRRYFPGARMVSTRWQDYTPPARRGVMGGGGQCLIIWPGGAGDGSQVKAMARDRLGVEIPEETGLRRVSLPLPGNPDRRLVWSFHLLRGTGECR